VKLRGGRAAHRIFCTLIAALFAAAPLAAQTSRDDRWRQDLTYLATELPRRHVNLFFQLARPTFDAAVQDLDRAIPSLTDAQVMVGLARIVALAGDGHTNLWLTNTATGFRRFPLTLYWFQDGLFVTRASDTYARAVGVRLLRIGDNDVERIYGAVSPLISHENDYWVRSASPDYFVIPEVLQALGFIPSANSASFTLQDIYGKVFTLDIAAVPLTASLNYVLNPDPAQGFLPLYRINTSQNYWFQYLDNIKTLYFAYNQAAEMPGVPFASFAQQLQAVFSSQRIDRLVVDLRNNTGGNTAVLQPFINEFISSGGASALRGRLFVIIGRRTYSTALIHAIQFKQDMGAILVGEPTGNKPNHPGNVLNFTLPNCGLTVNYSTKFFTLWPTDTDSLYPDVAMELWSSDIFARHDPFFAAVLAYQGN